MQKINKLNLTYQLYGSTSTTSKALLLFCTAILAMSNVFFYLESRCTVHVYTCLSVKYCANDSQSKNPVLTTLFQAR